MIGQVPIIFDRLNDISVNRRSVFICAKLDELKMYIYTKHTKCYTGFSNTGNDLNINGTDVDRQPQSYANFINNLPSVSSHCDGWLHFGLSRCWLYPIIFLFFLIVRPKLSQTCETRPIVSCIFSVKTFIPTQSAKKLI